jgi:beta-mannanase
MICISEGSLPHGTGILDLPAKNITDHCYLGAHHPELPGEYYKVPQDFEAQFPSSPAKKIKYAHSYMQWGTNGTASATAMPGTGLQTLINNGYTPILTWEPQFKGFAPLDAVQPRLSNIINGDYNTFIDNFADKMKLYTDTVIIRFMHEFDGDWYPWCISQNGGDASKLALAFKTVVQRFRTRGATKVKWMWCPNNDYKPYSYYNYIVDAYPGDSFVDIVGTDVYNAHYPASLPWWRSF